MSLQGFEGSVENADRYGRPYGLVYQHLGQHCFCTVQVVRGSEGSSASALLIWHISTLRTKSRKGSPTAAVDDTLLDQVVMASY